MTTSWIRVGGFLAAGFAFLCSERSLEAAVGAGRALEGAPVQPASLERDSHAASQRSQPGPAAVDSASSLWARLPAEFVENLGQWNTPAKFVAWKGPMVASFEADAVRLSLGVERPTSLGLEFEAAATRTVTLVGEAPRDGCYNFFLGNDPAHWRSNVAAFGSVLYRGIYEGVDVRVRVDAGRLEYDVMLAPGADLGEVVIRVEGAEDLELASDGSLTICTADGSIVETPPHTWVVLPSGGRRAIDSRFRLIDKEHFGFEAPGRDPDLALVVDPGLDWSTFLGGGNREEIHGLALATDGTGDVIVAGHTWSADFPASSGGLGLSPLVPFVARLTSNGSGLVYATLFGGTSGNVGFAYDVALDATSAPVVVGETNALDFPTTPGAYDPTFNQPSASINREWDAFVTRFDALGGQMVFSTFLGAAPIFDPSRPGSERGGAEAALAVAVDASGSVIVAGRTNSEDFPTTIGAFDRTLAPLQVQVDLGGVPGTIESRTDAFVARFNPTGTQLTYSTYLGGEADDLVKDMVLDAQGFVTLVGLEAPLETFDAQNNRTDHGLPFPTTPDAVRRTHLGASDAILARMKLDGAGAADLKYATIFGGDYIDETLGVALDPTNSQSVTLCGDTRSWDFPTTSGAWSRSPIFLSDGVPYYSGFVARFQFPATGGGSLVWSTLVEGTIGGQIVHSVAVDASGDVIVVGTDEGGLPTTERSFKRDPASGIFLQRFSGDGKNLLYATFLDRLSSLFQVRQRLASSGPHAVIVSGATLQPTFPTTPGAFDRVFGSDGTSDFFHRYDGFVARLTLDPNLTSDTSALAPTLVSPANGAVIPMSTPLSLDWSDVADPSGVQSYQLALSANPEFLPGFGFILGAGSYTVSQFTAAGPAFSDGVFFWRVRTLDGVNNFSPWSEVRKFTIGAPVWTNFAAASLTPNGVAGGSTVQGKVFVQNVALAGGQVYTLTSSNPAAASVPASVTVPAGANTATFTVTTHTVSVSTPVKITVWSAGNGDNPVLWVDPGAPGVVSISSLSLAPTSVTGGVSSQGTVSLSGAAPAGGALVSLASSNTSVATVPISVTVPAGAASASFTIATSTVTTTTSAIITASWGGTTRTATLGVTPTAPPPVPAAPTLISPANDANPAQPITFDWNDVPNATTYTIQIDDTSSLSTPLTVNQSVTVSQFTTSGLSVQRLFWHVRGVNSAGVAGPWSATRRFLPQAAPIGPTPTAVGLSPASLVGGSASQGSVTLSGAAPSGGALVSLLSSNPAVASIAASASVSGGATSTTFSVTTSSVTVTSTAILSATLNGVTRTATLTVTPAPATASLQSLALSTSSVTGGTGVSGTLTLTSGAPTGGALITLASSNPAVASVPPSATVTAGSTSGTFNVTTSSVSTSTSLTISATFAGVMRTATLTVAPAPSGPLPAPAMLSPAVDAQFTPGQSITFDWGDVTGAASYTIQIDDSSSPTAPFTLQQTLSVSQLTTSTLPTLRMWWRVRANDSAGTPGAWSSTRRFEVRN